MRYLGPSLSVRCLIRSYLQHLEDKIAGKLASWNLKNVNMVGRRVLVWAVLTSQAIYHITSAALPKEVHMRLIVHLRVYLWVGCNKVTGGNCEVN
jgi:hypothetical protein